MPTLLSLFPLGSELRQFGHSGLFTRLVQQGWRVIVAAKIADNDLIEQLDDSIEVVPLPMEGVPFVLARLISILDRAHALKEKRSGKSNWLYSTHKPKNWKVRAILALESAAGVCASFSPFAQHCLVGWESKLIGELESGPARDLLEMVNPDAILLNVPRMEVLLPLLNEARRGSIPTLVMYHTWKDVSANGRINFPFSQYGVWNEPMRAELLRQNSWINPDHVTIAGCGHFQCVGRQDLIMPEDEFRLAMGARPDSRLIFFPASAPWLVPGEERYVRCLQSMLQAQGERDIQIVVRLNPMDEEGRLAKILSQDKPEVLVTKPDWRWDKGRNWCFQRRSDQLLYNSLLHYCSACVGIPSTVAVECAVADLPIVNIGFDLPGAAPQTGTIGQFWEADFYREVRTTGAAALARTESELAPRVLEALHERGRGSASRKLLVSRQLGIAAHGAVDAAASMLAAAVPHHQPCPCET